LDDVIQMPILTNYKDVLHKNPYSTVGRRTLWRISICPVGTPILEQNVRSFVNVRI